MNGKFQKAKNIWFNKRISKEALKTLISGFIIKVFLQVIWEVLMFALEQKKNTSHLILKNWQLIFNSDPLKLELNPNLFITQHFHCLSFDDDIHIHIPVSRHCTSYVRTKRNEAILFLLSKLVVVIWNFFFLVLIVVENMTMEL